MRNEDQGTGTSTGNQHAKKATKKESGHMTRKCVERQHAVAVAVGAYYTTFTPSEMRQGGGKDPNEIRKE